MRMGVWIACATLLVVSARAAQDGPEASRLLVEGERVAVELDSGWIIIARFAGADPSDLTIALVADGIYRGYIRIPAEQIRNVRPVHDSELADTPKRRRKLTGAEAPREREPGLKVGAKPATVLESLSTEEITRLALLEEFPPGAAWSDERYALIRERDFMMDLRPTLKEERFYEVYPEWLAAKALQTRLDRGEFPDQWLQVLAPEVAFELFPAHGALAEKDYRPLREHMFAEDFEMWKAGRNLVVVNGGLIPDPRQLSKRLRESLAVYISFPEHKGWNEARATRLESTLSAEEALTEDQRLFVRAFPDYLEGKSMQAKKEADKREQNLSYDEVNTAKETEDVTGENISDTSLSENVSKENVVPLDYENKK